MKPPNPASIYHRVCDIIESARTGAARSVNTAQVVSNWLIGREIVEEEQGGRARAKYGKRLIEKLSERLMRAFGPGFAVRNLETFRAFYLEFPKLTIPHAVRAELQNDASQLMPQAGSARSWRRMSRV